MAFAEKLPSGKWRGGHWVKTYDGKRHKQWIGTFDRKTDAREAALESEVKARRVAATSAGTASARMTWAQWWEIYTSKREFASLTQKVQNTMARTHLLPQWGTTPLNQINRRVAQQWVDSLVRNGYSDNYVNNLFAVFRASVKKAVAQDILTANPLEGVQLPRIHRQAKVYTTEQDLKLMRSHLPPVYADALEFLLETGLRPGELGGLHLNRLDLEQGWISVVEVYVDVRHFIRPCPKDGDTRTVPLTSRAIEIAQRQLHGRELRAHCGIPHTEGTCQHDLLFRNVRGGVLRPALLGSHLNEASKAAGIDTRGGYSGRRGFATRAASGGMDAFLLADILGHNDVRVTREYVQMTRDSRLRLMAALGEGTTLSSVGDVGQRGTEHGTNPENHPLPSTPNQAGENAS